MGSLGTAALSKDVFLRDNVVLRNLPIPVSVNDYCNRRHPTPEKKRFMSEFRGWELGNLLVADNNIYGAEGRTVELVRKHLFGDKFSEYQENKAKKIIEIKYIWYMDIYHKNGVMRKVDTSNFVKCIEDSISEWLGIDDRYFKNFSMTVFDKKDEKESFEAIIYA